MTKATTAQALRAGDQEEASGGCGYTGYEFGAAYPDSTCIDGYLWDLDSCDEPGGGLTQGGDIPCPQCNPEDAPAQQDNQQGDVMGVSDHQKKPLVSVLYRLLERHGADHEVLSVVGSLFDTLPTADVIALSEDWLSSGEIIRSPQ